jgi:hypothetical protein
MGVVMGAAWCVVILFDGIGVIEGHCAVATAEHVRVVVYYDYATEEQPYCNTNTSCPRPLCDTLVLGCHRVLKMEKSNSKKGCPCSNPMLKYWYIRRSTYY